MIAVWKLKRELLRFQMQIAQWHWHVFGKWRRDSYDRNRKEVVRTDEGLQPFKLDIAILLIYQPTGVLRSFLAELEHFCTKGFSTIVVSNAPISDADLDLLKSKSHLVIQRPNYGYDFGGYREGVLTMFERGIHPRNLIIKNDSIWFPIWPDCDFIDRAVQSQADLYGVYLNRRAGQTHRSHIQSYFYRFSPKITAASDFENYWKNLFVADNKHAVIRQCEMKLTNWFKLRGYSVDALYDNYSLKEAMKALDDAQLGRLIRYQTIVETRSAAVLSSLITDGPESPGWRERLEALIDAGRFGAYFQIMHPLALLGKLRAPVLKKDRQPMYQLQRQELIDCNFGHQLTPEVYADVLTWDLSKKIIASPDGNDSIRNA